MISRTFKRHAVRLQYAMGRFEAKPYIFTRDIPNDGLLIRNLHTLVGTRTDLSVLKYLNHLGYCQNRPGYTTVSKVEEIGHSCTRFAHGDQLLLSARYETLSLEHMSSVAVLGRLGSEITDPILDLFTPLVGYALMLASVLPDLQYGEVVLLFGCGPIGALLAQILTSQMDALVVAIQNDSNDLEPHVLFECGVDKVVTDPKQLSEKQRRAIRHCFIFSEKQQALEQAQLLALNAENYTHIPDIGSHARAPDFTSLHDAAVGLLQNGSVNANLLVADHIHPESAEKAFQLSASAYPGQLLICDW